MLVCLIPLGVEQSWQGDFLSLHQEALRCLISAGLLLFLNRKTDDEDAFEYENYHNPDHTY